MGVKGAVLALYTLGVGCLLLFAQSGTGAALGVALIALVSTAVVAKLSALRAADTDGSGGKRRAWSQSGSQSGSGHRNPK
ncbi:hypothetical protein [Halogeometricum borinquense]|uniref:hypothetical protein n=1 Tax=Halogeometricum borinquense TaxID=60847 RepID=UPI000677AAB9|nr:hypothetical protein [Halogeometricum borinquense]